LALILVAAFMVVLDDTIQLCNAAIAGQRA